MRRTIANLLLLVFGSLLAAPVLRPGDELPACCRRDGKHQCALRQPAPQGPAAQNVPTRCAQYPSASRTSHADPFSAVPTLRQLAQTLRPDAVALPRVAPVRDTSRRSTPERGPPSCLA